jgi:hypothetical protein
MRVHTKVMRKDAFFALGYPANFAYCMIVKYVSNVVDALIHDTRT